MDSVTNGGPFRYNGLTCLRYVVSVKQHQTKSVGKSVVKVDSGSFMGRVIPETFIEGVVTTSPGVQH